MSKSKIILIILFAFLSSTAFAAQVLVCGEIINYNSPNQLTAPTSLRTSVIVNRGSDQIHVGMAWFSIFADSIDTSLFIQFENPDNTFSAWTVNLSKPPYQITFGYDSVRERIVDLKTASEAITCKIADMDLNAILLNNAH